MLRALGPQVVCRPGQVCRHNRSERERLGKNVETWTTIEHSIPRMCDQTSLVCRQKCRSPRPSPAKWITPYSAAMNGVI